MEKEELIEGILALLQTVNPDPNRDSCERNIKEIFDFLKKNGLEDSKESLKMLDNLLEEMERDRLIEGGSYQIAGHAYAIENKGIELIMRIEREYKLRSINLDIKWRLPN